MINSTCVWVDNNAAIAYGTSQQYSCNTAATATDNTAAIVVAKENDFTHEMAKHVTVKV